MLSNQMLAAVLLVDAAVDVARDEAIAGRDRRRAEAEQQQRISREREERRRRRMLTQAGQLALAAVGVAFVTAVFWAMCAATDSKIAHTVWFNLANVRTPTFGDFVGLWIYIAITLLIGVLVLLILGSNLPYPEEAEIISSPGRWGFGIGIVLFIIEATTGAGGGVWWLPAVFGVLGHGGYGLFRHARANG
ncbi:hypothetical protein [Nocardia sp. NPDC004722]